MTVNPLMEIVKKMTSIKIYFVVIYQTIYNKNKYFYTDKVRISGYYRYK